MQKRDPAIVFSDLSRPVTRAGLSVTVEIFRLEHEPCWHLEVVLQRTNSPVSVTSDATAQPYAGIAAQQDAEERAAWEASQFIKTDIIRALSAK